MFIEHGARVQKKGKGLHQKAIHLSEPQSDGERWGNLWLRVASQQREMKGAG